MTKKEVLAMVKELKVEEKKVEYIPVYYKRKGQMIRRSYDDTKYTARYYELLHAITDAEIFPCEECGKKVSYFDIFEGICPECFYGDI